MIKFGLPFETIEKINSVFKKHPEIEKVIIYGSRARENFRPGSDIDLTLKGKNLTYDIIPTVRAEIDDLNTPYLFDISIFNLLKSPDLEEHIHRLGQVFYEK